MSPAAVTLAPTHPAVADTWLQTGPHRLTRLITGVCPGPASEHVDLWLSEVGKRDGSGEHPALWRIGSAHLPGHPDKSCPVAIPLLDDAHLHITTTGRTRRTAEHLVETLLMRILSSFRPGLVRIHLWDARQMAGSLPGLYPLMDEGLFTVEDPTQLGVLLDQLRDRCTTVFTRALSRGHRSLAEQAAATTDGARSEPWTIAVLLGDGTVPDGAYAALQRVSRNALPAGMSLIVVDLPVPLAGHTTQIVLDGPRNRCSAYGPRLRLIPDLPIEPRRLSAAAAKLATWYGDWRVREASFRDLLPAEHGGCSTVESVAAPLGFSETGSPVYAELGDATPHMLVGGASGSGKTNLLLGWLMAMAARYSPDELALYLLDFKDGVSFAPLAGGPSGEQWLPHARLVGVNINDDREFGVALLRHLAAELRRRADAAKKVGGTKLAELRRADPDGHWPRIVAVIDEVQILLEPANDPVTDEAVQILEDLARRGRALGIHLVLASQNLADVRALWARKAILEQFSLRIGTPRASGVFADQNHALKALPRFHAIVNTEGGEEHGNTVARIPNACARGTADQAQTELHARWGDPNMRPVLLDGSVHPTVHDLWTPNDTPHVTVGRGFTVDGAPATAQLDARPGRNLAVLGVGARQEAPRVLSCAAAGLATQGVTLDLVAFDELGEAHADWVAAHAPDARRVTAAGFSAHLDVLAAEIAARNNGAPRPPHAVAIWQVDAIESRFDDDDIDLLKTVIHHGPEVGVHFLGWWRSADRLLSLLYSGAASAEDIGIWAVCDVVGADIGSVMPGLVANGWDPRPGRGFLWDRDRTAEGRQLFMTPTLNGDSNE